MDTKQMIENVESHSFLPQPDGIDLWDGEIKEFELDGKDFSYQAWDGQEISGQFVAIDTETVVIDVERLKRVTPKIVIAQASGKKPEENFIIHPEDMGRFIEIHRDKSLVFFNIAFDFPVIEKALRGCGESKASQLLWESADSGRCHDVMLLDQLVRIAEGGPTTHRRSLADAAEDLLGIELEKEDTPRCRYETLLVKNYRGISQDFYEYAARDSRVTGLCFAVLWKKAWDMHQKISSRSNEFDIDKSSMWAPLTEQIQVRAALALEDMSKRGIQVDADRLSKIRSEALERLNEAAKAFNSDRTVKEFEKENGEVLKKTTEGDLRFTDKHTPRKSLKQIRELFRQLCLKHGEKPPMTEKKLIATSRDAYVGMRVLEAEPVFIKYFTLQELATDVNKPEALLEHSGDKGRIHPGYTVLEKTGRTSSSRPQVQNLPRQGALRGCLVPGDGTVFYGVDYSSIELVALAAICKHRYGFSRLAEKIAEGVDTHSFTAAEVLGKEIDDVTREERQSAKIINFGVPGGMGAKALAHNAKAAYDLDMSQQEAQKWKDKLINEIYPEIGLFLDDWLERFISVETGVPAGQIVDYLIEATEADGFSSDAEDWVLSSLKQALYDGRRANGSPYSERWINKLWAALRRVVTAGQWVSPEMKDVVKYRRVSPHTARLFFPTRASTLTGRIQGGVNFRQGHNSQFQGLAADGLKLAIYRLMREGWRPVLEVHDEVIVEVPADCSREEVAGKIDRILIEEMQRVIGDDIPVAVEGKFMERLEK